MDAGAAATEEPKGSARGGDAMDTALYADSIDSNASLVLEEARLTNDAYLFGTNPHKSFPYFPFKHAMPPGRSFHMLNGQPDQNVTEAAIAEALAAFMK